jgi:hypothetical protein
VKAHGDEKVLGRVRGEVKALCDQFPAPGIPTK